mmetsp:Transcript_32579/g.79266  ORF Transcript_32579/g.79266 Transcript_32579/m.79266 type:complete len:393 (-) Transcript_32579:885-2063(-)
MCWMISAVAAVENKWICRLRHDNDGVIRLLSQSHNDRSELRILTHYQSGENANKADRGESDGGDRRNLCGLDAWIHLQRHCDRWIGVFDNAVEKLKIHKMARIKEEMVRNMIVQHRNNSKAFIHNTALKLFPKWLRHRNSFGLLDRLDPRPNATIANVNQITERLVEREVDKPHDGIRYCKDLYRFQTLDRMREEVRSMRDQTKQSLLNAVQTQTERFPPSLDQRFKVEVHGQGAVRKANVKTDLGQTSMVKPRFVPIQEGPALPGVDDGREVRGGWDKRRVMGLEVMNFTPSIKIFDEIYPRPKTLEESKYISRLAAAEEKLRVSEEARRIRKLRKEMGLPRGQFLTDYLNPLPGKRGKAYMKRPAHIRRRQRRRFIIVGRDSDRKVYFFA